MEDSKKDADGGKKKFPSDLPPIPSPFVEEIGVLTPKEQEEEQEWKRIKKALQ